MNLYTKYFPYIQKNFKSYANIVVWGIGANIGNCIKTFNNLFKTLINNPFIKIHSTSNIYKNPAFGYEKQPDFYNTTIIFSTSLCVKAIFSLMFYLERKFGRKRIRDFKNAPRTLDIDLIFYANKHVYFNHMKLPHIDYNNRKSVLLPLKFQLGLL